MSNDSKTVFIIAGCGAAVLFILLTTFFGKLPEADIPSPRLGDWIANWIAAYQTLLSAVIATGGVLITIFAMNKNNKEVLYAEWRTLIFKAMNFKANLNTAKLANERLINVEINAIVDLETLSTHCDLVYSNLLRMRHILKIAQNSDLDLYTQGHISIDILSIDHCMQSVGPRLSQFRKIQSFNNFSHKDYKDFLVSWKDIYAQIDGRSAAIIEHFIEGSRKFNPMSLNVKGF